MANKIILSADSTCDLSPELKERYQVQYFPYHIILGGQQYMDGVDIQPEDLYLAYREKKQLPKTAAISAILSNGSKKATKSSISTWDLRSLLPIKIAGWRPKSWDMFTSSTRAACPPVWACW